MERTEQELMWAVQALALPAGVQPTLFPHFVCVADELALDFDNWRQVAVCQYKETWSETQTAAVAALDQLLTAMSGPDRPELWVEDGCLRHPQWTEVRRLAKEALAAFGWSAAMPPADRGIYVPGG